MYRVRTELLILCVLAAAAAPAGAQDEPPTAAESAQSGCEAERTQMLPRLDAVLAAHAGAGGRHEVAELVAWDREIRAALRWRSTLTDPCHDEYDLWREEYAAIGLERGYDEDLGYSGKLLIEAHALDPHSPFRALTLYSEISSAGLDEAAASSLGGEPAVAATQHYLAEFPEGPFAANVHALQAGYYKDLYMALRDGQEADYHYDCMQPFFTDEPIAVQLERARDRAIEHYQRALALNPSNSWAPEAIDQLRDGTVQAWSYCAD